MSIIRLHAPHDINSCDWCRETRRLRRLTRFNRRFRNALIVGGIALFLVVLVWRLFG